MYPAFGNYIQDYTGAIVRWNYDASTILATYDVTTGEDIVFNALNGTAWIDTQSVPFDESSQAVDGTTVESVLPPEPPKVVWSKEDPKKILYPIHIVTPKQTLEDIKRQYIVSLDALLKANPGLTDDLKIDQKIVIPTIKGVEYVVKKGDTLSVIAAKYGIGNLYHILVANDLTSAAKIRIGQKLLLPNPTKDPNQKKPDVKPAVSTVVKNTKSPVSTVVKNAPKNNTSTAPQTLTYGSYSLEKKVDQWCRNFAWGNCTCFVAKYKNVTWRWNAKQWLKNAQKAGAKTGSDPKPGAIIVYDGYGYSPSYGHVGIVMEVNEEYIIIKDMNYSALNQITTRREDYRKNPAIQGYIYVD